MPDWRELDEYSDADLRGELTRRHMSEVAGLCPYCGAQRGEITASGWSSCRFPEQHGMEPGHAPHLVLGAVRHSGLAVTQEDIDAEAARRASR